MNRKTKIVCTLGPATDGDGILRQMLEAGMNVARFNFSHGSHEEHKRRLAALKARRQERELRAQKSPGARQRRTRRFITRWTAVIRRMQTIRPASCMLLTISRLLRKLVL